MTGHHGLSLVDPKASIKPGIQWQWKKTEGNFVDYSENMNMRIETAYQLGRPFVLVRLRDTEDDPIEVWFGERKQIIRHSDQADEWNDIQRVGEESFTDKANRNLKVLKQFIDHGTFEKKWVFEEQQGVQQLGMRETADVHSSNLGQHYSAAGAFANIARHSMFTFLTLVVIVLNTVWLGIDAHYNDAESLYDAHWNFAVVENIFCMFYLVELIIRIGAFKKKSTCIRDGWIIFDATLIVLMVVEIWVIPLYLATLSSTEHVDADSDANKGGEAILRVARMLKVLRLGRLAKVVVMIPELMSMCKAIFKAMQSVFFTVLMLATVIYVFAIILVVQMRDHTSITEELPDFKSISGSMWILLTEGVLLLGSDSLQVFVKHSYVMTTLFLVFIALSTFTILNMLIGIVCQVVDKETSKKRDADDLRYLQSTLLELMQLHDEDDDKTIQEKEFEILMRNPWTKHVLTRMGVDANDLLLMKRNLFDSQDAALEQSEEGVKTNSTKEDRQNGLSHSEVLKVVLRLRGSNTSTVTDIVDLREYIDKRFMLLEEFFRRDSQEVDIPRASQSTSTSGGSSLGEMIPRRNFGQAQSGHGHGHCGSHGEKRQIPPQPPRAGFTESSGSMMEVRAGLGIGESEPASSIACSAKSSHNTSSASEVYDAVTTGSFQSSQDGTTILFSPVVPGQNGADEILE